MRNKLTLFIFSLVVVISCIAQKESFERKIDIKDFERKTYYTEDSTHIKQFRGGGYAKYISKKDSLYSNYYWYNKDGLLDYRGKMVRYGSGSFGKWYTYDEKGNVTKIEDEDEIKGYTFKFEDVLAYAERNNINLHKATIYKQFGGWAIDYTGEFKGIHNRYKIILDKETGEKDSWVGSYSGKRADPKTGGTRITYDTVYYKGVRYPRE